jgi:hypothetical protein
LLFSVEVSVEDRVGGQVRSDEIRIRSKVGGVCKGEGDGSLMGIYITTLGYDYDSPCAPLIIASLSFPATKRVIKG